MGMSRSCAACSFSADVVPGCLVDATRFLRQNCVYCKNVLYIMIYSAVINTVIVAFEGEGKCGLSRGAPLRRFLRFYFSTMRRGPPTIFQNPHRLRPVQPPPNLAQASRTSSPPPAR